MALSTPAVQVLLRTRLLQFRNFFFLELSCHVEYCAIGSSETTATTTTTTRVWRGKNPRRTRGHRSRKLLLVDLGVLEMC